jgi:succinate-semialdehyde dehydrogenase/glutarate-semialdehyde dehydrogenase
MSLASSTVKRVSLELGGNAPFIFFEDADLDLAMRGIMVSKFRNAGQTCICANRIFVHRSRLTEFTEALLPKVRGLTLGSGFERGVTTGPLINDRALQRAHGLVTRALDAGAELLCGGQILNRDLESSSEGVFYAPTVLAQVTAEMEIARAELFAPIVTLIPFDDEADVVRMANDTPYGLAAYFFTEDHRRIWRVSEALEYGMVAVNDGSISTAVAPFGGVKESGIGREGSSWGLDEFLEMKYVMMGSLDR